MTAIDTTSPAAGARRSGGVVPVVDVRVDGRPLAEDVRRRLVSLRVASRLSQPTQCEFAFTTWRDAAAGYDDTPVGARIEVAVAGPGTATARPVFAGEVTAIELVHEPDGAAFTRVRAYDLLHRLRARQTPRVFEDVTVADLARALSGDLDLHVVADDPGPRRDRIVQHAQSDLELLVERANRAGLYVVVEGDELRLVTLAGTGDRVPLELGTSLLEARIAVNVTGTHRRFRAVGWQPQRAEVIEERAETPRGSAQVAFDVGALADVAEERTDVGLTGRTDEEIAAFAQARLDASSAAAVTLRGVAEGDTSLRAGTRVDLRGVAPTVQGTYVLTEAIHTVDGTGFRTEISSVPPPAPVPARGGSSVTLGRVSDVADPEGLGRVRVMLPALGDVDAGWLGVVCPGAGRDKGLVALPDVEDTVLVALPHGEPADGVVLGPVFGLVPPPDPGIVDGAVGRWTLSTPSGHSIVLDDDRRRIRVSNGAGSFLELGPDQVRLHARADLVVEAPGHTLTIRAAAVDFTHAPEPDPPADDTTASDVPLLTGEEQS